jgi:hypothetical protein
MMHRLRTLCAVVALIASTVAPAGATGFGVNAHVPSNAITDRIADAGIEWVRIDVLWSVIEPARDVYDWSVYDALVDRLEARGLRIYAGMGATPAWATSGPAFSGVPDEPDQWREFCFLVAARYAGRVDAWGPWNEPNLDRFWDGSRREYLDIILLPAIDSIRLADPNALIGAPDLAHLSSGNWDDWLDQVVREARDRIDVVTHHVYPSDGRAWEVTADLESGDQLPFGAPSVIEVLEDAGWSERPFWLTETGVESGRWGESRQADFVEDLLFDWFSLTRGRRDWVDRVFFYEMADAAPPAPYSFGLVGGPPDLEPKLAYTAYADFIADAEVDDAALIEASIPRYYDLGMTVATEIVFANTGTTTWSFDDGIRLSITIDTAGWNVDVEQLGAGETVPPGEVHGFPIILTGPVAPAKEIGEQPVLKARLERDGDWFFGDEVRQQVILVAGDPPVVGRQPDDLILARDAAGSLHVTASGDEPLSFQWLRNGVPLEDGELYGGAASDSLTIRAVTDAVAAIYHCRIRNDVGDVVSDAATVTVGQPGPRSSGRRLSPIAVSPPATPIDTPPRLTGPAPGHSGSRSPHGAPPPNHPE